MMIMNSLPCILISLLLVIVVLKICKNYNYNELYVRIDRLTFSSFDTYFIYGCERSGTHNKTVASEDYCN